MKTFLYLIIVFCATFSIIPCKILAEEQEDVVDTLKNSSGIAYVPIVYYTPETRLALGAGVLYLSRSSKDERPSLFTATAIYTTNKQFMGELSSGIFFENGKYWHTGNFYYYLFPNDFYGIGNNTPKTAKENFTIEVLRINPSLLVRIAEKLFLGPVVHFETWRFQKTEPGQTLATGIIPGSKQTIVTGIGMLMNYDERDNLFAAMSGRFYQAGFIASPKLLGSTFNFARLQLDVREYFPLGKEHIISVQAVFHTTTGTVPFRFLPKLGGQNILRGYFEGRYRDNHMAVLQSEYRTPIWWRFGLATFGGFGDVTNKLSRFRLREMKISYGAGIRFAFIPEERIILRIDYGKGKNSDGVYITFNEAI